MSASPRRELPLPPDRTTRSGRVRRIGVQLELGGLELDAAARIVLDHVGGSLGQRGRYEKEVVGDVAGPWGIELDFAWLKELGRQNRDPDAAWTPLQEAGEDALRGASEWLVPVEVVSPPLSMERLGEVDDLIDRLRRSGARGTGGGFFYAFGLQLNPEVPDTDADTVLRYLRAFLCLADWLEQRAEVALGGRPLHLDPERNERPEPVDGVVIIGGHDIEPVLYASAPEVETKYDTERDAFESFIIDEALEQGLPLLGICRGAQLLNVRLGGSLYQELRSQRVRTSNRWTVFPLETLLVESGCLLHRLIGTGRARINSLHDQGIDELGRGLTVCGRDLDGIVQAVEATDRDFVLGVQWHPELLLFSRRQRRLFRELVATAGRRAVPAH